MASVTLVIPAAEEKEAKEAGMAFTGLPETATAKELLASTFNELMRKWRNETKGAAKGGIS